MRKQWLKNIGFWLFILIGTVGIGSWNSSSAFYICAAMWGLFPFLCLPLLWIGRSKVVASFSPSKFGEKGELLEIRIRIENHARFSYSSVICKLEVENELSGATSQIFMETAVEANGSQERSLKIQSDHCGYLNVHIKKIYLLDPLGIFPIACKGKGSGSAVILPDTFDLKIFWHPEMIEAKEADSWSAYYKGQDPTEIFEMRDYKPEDPLKKIHWKLSSKRQKLIIKEGSTPEEKSWLLFWDKETGDASPEELDCLAETVVSFAKQMAEEGISFVLGWSNGKENEYRIITSLQECIETIPELLRKRKQEKATSVELEGEYGSVFLFTKQIGADYKVGEHAKVLCFVCEEGATHPIYPVVDFTPDNYKEKLQRYIS